MTPDLIFAIGNAILALMLLPTVCGSKLPSPWTALAYTVITAVFAYTSGTIGLIISLYTTSVSAGLWLVILLRSVHDYFRTRKG